MSEGRFTAQRIQPHQINASVNELKEERDLVKAMLG